MFLPTPRNEWQGKRLRSVVLAVLRFTVYSFSSADFPILLTTKTIISKVHPHAGVVELVDTQASGVCGGNPVEVQVLSSV